MPGQSYTSTFGGETINPALLSYIAYTIRDDLELVWPIEAPPDANVAADKIDITASLFNLGVTVPPANQASVGTDILFRNTGSATYSVYDQDGVEIGSVASGEAWYFVLTDNSDEAGVWYAIQFGMGTSSATAASLAGAGLRANLSLLDQNLATNALLGDYSVTSPDRSTVLQNNGGAVAYTFDSAVTLGNGFFVYVINAGTGALTLTPGGGQTIDGSAIKTLAPTETAAVFSDGSNFHTLGYGRSLVNTVTGASINVAGSGTLSLSSAEVAAQVQDWSGTIAGNRILDYGGGVGYWFVWNNSAGAFTITARVDGLDPGVAVTQGAFSILRSNGTTMSVAFTATSGTVTSVATTANLTGGPITTTGTLDLSNTGVAAGAYGDAATTVTATVDVKGRLTSVVANAISILISQIQTFSSAALRGRISDPTGTGSAVFGTAPTITNAVLVTPDLGVATATSINGNTIPVAADVVTLNTAVQTLTNKTLTSPTINTPTINNATLTVPTQAQATNSTLAASTGYADRIAVQQVVVTQQTAVVSGAGVTMPLGGSPPTNAQGDEVMTVTITPKSATSKLVITVVAVGSVNAVDLVSFALFQDATVNSIAAAGTWFPAGTPLITMGFSHEMVSGTTSATTFKLRAGANSAGTFYLNGNSGLPNLTYGGVSASSMTVVEYGV